MPEIPEWTFGELSEIDKLYSKAREIGREASELKDKGSYDLCIRRSQEAFEIYLKVICKLMKEGYPTNSKGHELSQQIRTMYPKIRLLLKDIFPKNYIIRDIVRISTGSKVLFWWRNPSFYGDEKLETLGISGIFTEKEAELALDYMNKASSLCHVIRDYFYRKGI